MTLDLVRSVNFGSVRSNITGSTGVGYTLYDSDGVSVAARTTEGVYQLLSGSGVYGATVSFPDNFHGHILWDCPIPTLLYATEHQNLEENDPRVGTTHTLVTQMSSTLTLISGSVDFLRDIEGGGWRIDTSLNRMIFYKSDNATEVASFDLYDDTGSPTSDAPFERRRR